jgi:hypothetical protein
MEPDYISWVDITDTFGVTHHRFEAKSLVRIYGKNGAGKSSIINGIAAVFEGGCNPTIIRKGATKSVVILGLASGATITKTTGYGKNGAVRATLEVLDPYGNPVAAPQTYVNRLSEAQAVDPGAILRIDASTAVGKKALTEMLLRIVPTHFTPAEVGPALVYEVAKAKSGIVSNLTGLKWIESRTPAVAAAPPEMTVSLGAIDALIEQVSAQRSRARAQAEETDSTVATLRQSIPPEADEPVDYAKELGAAEAERTATAARADERRQQINDAKREALLAVDNELRTSHLNIDAEIDAQIADLNRQRGERKLAASERHGAAQRNAMSAAEWDLKQLEGEAGPLLAAAAGRIATLRAAADAQGRAIMVHQQIETYMARSMEASWRHSQLSAVVDRLKALRKSKLDATPIPGLEVSETMGPSVDGIPWQNVNMARLVEIAIQLCAQCSGVVGFQMLDGAEALDTYVRAAIEEEVVRNKIQLIETFVSDGPLRIESVDFEVAA